MKHLSLLHKLWRRILYYLGAGASAQALPLARSVLDDNDIEPLIPGLAYEMRRMSDTFDFSSLTNQKNIEFIQGLKNRLNTLAAKADEFGDVDTYAKYLLLMHSGGSQLAELKQTLSCYFVIKQAMREATDSRYLPWLVSIMNDTRFPENVKILNWNYDFQVELAASQLGTLEEVEHAASSFVYSRSTILHYPNIDPSFSDYHELSIVHLNGIAGLIRESISNTGSAFQKKNRHSHDELISFLRENNVHRQLHFAWEKGDYHKSLLEHIQKMIFGTTILVVIGYSFPFFNREIDKHIFSLLTREGILQKIYYQDPILDGQQLKSQFNLNPNYEIVSIKNINNFHIPFEY